MKRIIKFRIWDKEKKSMYVVKNITFRGMSRGLWTINDNNPDIYELMQFTGLKDKNGKEIYEGDICKSPYDNRLNWEVYYDDAKFWLRSGDRIYGDQNACDDAETRVSFERCKVIGDIYENPKLLEI